MQGGYFGRNLCETWFTTEYSIPNNLILRNFCLKFLQKVVDVLFCHVQIIFVQSKTTNQQQQPVGSFNTNLVAHAHDLGAPGDQAAVTCTRGKQPCMYCIFCFLNIPFSDHSGIFSPLNINFSDKL